MTARRSEGGSRFVYESFDAAAARIEANERVANERWAGLEYRLGLIEATLERLEKRIWVGVYGVAAFLLAQMIAFFEARAGQLHGFRWKDWSDYKSCAPLATPGPEDQLIGTGDGVTTVFQLQKTYVSGLQSYTRPIRKPVPGTVVVAVAEDPKIEGLEFTVDVETGQIVFTLPPDLGTRVTAGFEFDVPARFDTDAIQTSVASFQAGDVPTVPVVEIRL
jgi:uncharacterized protein (TIGR02217 family)